MIIVKKPKIRFKGFTETWEQRKLEEICESFEYGLNAAAKEYDGENKYIRITDIDDNSHEFIQDDVTSPDIDLTNSENYQLKYGDVLFTRTGASVGKTYIYKESDGLVYYAGFLIRGRVKSNYSPEFIFQNTLTDDYDKFIRITSQRSGQPGVNAQEYASYEISVPKFEEQQKIGAYFSTLDHLITLHQRKCENLKKLKKFMLQKLFPQNGENVPKIRFSNFTDTWEQRKFSEGVSEIGDGLHGTPIYCEDGNVYFINGNNLVDGKIVISAETKKVNESQQSTADKSLDDITILMSINGTIGNLAYYSGERLMLGKSAAYIKVSEFDKRFVYAYLQAPSVQGYFMDSLTGTTIKNLGLKAIREMIMFIPQDVDEQKRIGKFFDYLDHLITLHQSKCDNLKELKKYMLQNMFI